YPLLHRLPFYYIFILLFLMRLIPPRSSLFPYTTLFRSYAMSNMGVEPAVVEHRRAVVDTLFSADTDAETLTDLCREEGITCLVRSEEHTSELQSRFDLVCRLLLEKKKLLKVSIMCLYQQ